MQKNLTRLFTAVLMAVLLCSATIISVSAADCTHTGDNVLTGATAALTEGTWYLSGDVTSEVTETIQVTGDVTLCLNGFTLAAPNTELENFIYVKKNASLTICGGANGNGTIAGGGDAYTRGIYVASGGTLTLNSGTISGFTCVKKDDSDSTKYGGGVGSSEGSTFSMTGGTISGNSSNCGGGLSVSGTFSMTGGSIKDNATTSNGSAMYTFSTAEVTISGSSSIEGKEGNTGGRTIFIYKSKSFHVGGDSVIKCHTKEDGSVTSAIYAHTTTFTMDGGKVAGAFETSSCTPTISGGSFTVDPTAYLAVGCEMTYTGGADYPYTVASYCEYNPGVHGGSWVELTADTTLTDGGKYYLSGAMDDVALPLSEGEITLCLNGQTMTAATGSIAITVSGGTLNICDCSAAAAGTIKGNADASVVNITAGTVNQYGGTITNGGGSSGGGVYVTGSSSKFNLYDGVISKNKVTGNGGGVRTASSGTFNMYGGTISNNSANNGGGVAANAPFYMYGGKIIGNTATIRGGGWYNATSSNKMSGGLIAENTATYGGGVSAYSRSVTLSGGQITANTSSSWGGGIEVYSGSAKKTLTISGCTIGGDYTSADGTKYTGNVAGGNGGGIYLYSSTDYQQTFVMTSGSIVGNKTEKAGGAGFINGSSGGAVVTISGGKIEDNIAGTNAGGLYLHTATASISSATISGNKANSGSGGGLYLLAGTTAITGGTISGNTATSYGPCMYGQSTNTMTISDGAFGGKIVHSGDVNITGGKFSDDTARDTLGGWLSNGCTAASTTSIMSVQENTDSDAATYQYKVGEGLYRSGSYVDFKSSLALGALLSADYIPVGSSIASTGYTATNKTVSDYVTNVLLVTATGIAAKNMDDQVAFTVTDADSNTVYTGTLSVYDAVAEAKAAEESADEIDADYVAMCEDVVNYGIAAQEEFEGASTMDALGTGTEGDIDWTAGAAAKTWDGEAAVSLNLKERIELNFYLKKSGITADDLSVTSSAGTVSKSDANTDVVKVTVTDIDVVKIKNDVTLTIGDAGDATLTYNIANYVNSNTTQTKLMTALKKYVDSVVTVLGSAE